MTKPPEWSTFTRKAKRLKAKYLRQFNNHCEDYQARHGLSDEDMHGFLTDWVESEGMNRET